jgi:hypothetical protein
MQDIYIPQEKFPFAGITFPGQGLSLWDTFFHKEWVEFLVDLKKVLHEPKKINATNSIPEQSQKNFRGKLPIQ